MYKLKGLKLSMRFAICQRGRDINTSKNKISYMSTNELESQYYNNNCTIIKIYFWVANTAKRAGNDFC